jgi:hypothetical protein
MKGRCERPSCTGYARYGGRGIRVCAEWSASFEAFMRDMGPRPSDVHSIERKDNDGNYEPGNCVWATRTEQNRNQARNRMVTVDGVTKPAAEWEDEAGLRRSRVRHRLELGWSPSDAVSRPAASRSKLSAARRAQIRREYASGGVSQNELGRRHGVHGTTIRSIVQGHSWRGDEAGAVDPREGL